MPVLRLVSTLPNSPIACRNWIGGRCRALASLLRLALTAPREEIGREICRIAVSFRRAGLFLWRIWDPARPPSDKDARWHDRAPAERPRDRRRTAANRSPAAPQRSAPKRPWQMDFSSQPGATSGLRLSHVACRSSINGNDTTLTHRATTANRKPTPQPTMISDHPSGVISTRVAKSGMLAAGVWPKIAT